MVHSSGALCVHVCVCFSSAFMIRFSPCNVLSGDYIGHPRVLGGSFFVLVLLFVS